MAGNCFGTLFKVVTFGESHGPAIGCVVDGCPAGLLLSPGDIKKELIRRRPLPPGNEGAFVSTARDEEDEPEILSGVFEGKTLGTPIAVLIQNKKANSADYDNLKGFFRPGHADETWQAKFGFRDHRGGGRASGRETASRVAAGAIARVFLASQGIDVCAWTSQAAGLDAPWPDTAFFSRDEIEKNPLRMPNSETAEMALEKIKALAEKGDSAGCSVSCIAKNLPAGLGEPVYDKLDARIAGAMLSIGAAKAIEFGAGFMVSRQRGSEQDYQKNISGGVLGGLSTGEDLFFTVAFKPVPSIKGKGRHDVCIAPRVVPVVEAMCALVLTDFVLMQRCARISYKD